MLTKEKVELEPSLKWAGGKRTLVPRLRTLWRHHGDRRLVEPFVGGMAVALGLRPSQALLNDVNVPLMNFYCWVRDGLRIEAPMLNDEKAYYAAREEFNAEPPRSRRAAELFYYLNRTGYNGLCRFNASGGFNVPFGRYKTINYRRDFSEYAPLLKRWLLLNLPWEGVEVGSDDFVYLDPPYDTPFTAYSPGGFTWEQQVALAERFAKHPGPVVASNQATDRVLALYGKLGYDIELIEAPRRISCKGDRTPAKEMLAARNVALDEDI